LLLETPELTRADSYVLLIADLSDLDYWNTEPPCDFEGLGTRQPPAPILKIRGGYRGVNDFVIVIHAS
jgi:hypothetical protein